MKNIKAIFDACQTQIKLANEILAQKAKEKSEEASINSIEVLGENIIEKNNENTVKVSLKDIGEDLVESIRESFSNILEFEKLFLIQAQDTYYGLVLSEMELNTDFSISGPIDVKIFNAHSNARFEMKVNPLYCEGYTLRELAGLIVGEILKISYDHPATFATLNSEKDPKKHENLEKGSSASVSSMILNDIRHIDPDNKTLSLPKNTYTATKMNNELSVTPKSDGSLEYYYYILEKFKKNPPSLVAPPSLADSSVSAPNVENENQTHDWEGNNNEDVHEACKELVRRVYNNLDSQSRGFMPSSLLSAIEKLLAPPEINWKQIFRKYIGATPVPYRKTRTRLNRRQPERFDLSGQLPKRIIDVVVAIDTSGSMSDKALAYIINEVFSMVKGREFKITIIECDAEIQKVYNAKKPSDVDVKMKGRGGTSFLPVIEFLNGTINDNTWKNHPQCGKFRNSLLLYFTDGYGDYEIPRPQTFRNMWVVLDDEKNLSLKEPYGEVKSLKGDKDYRKMMGM